MSCQPRRPNCQPRRDGHAQTDGYYEEEELEWSPARVGSALATILLLACGSYSVYSHTESDASSPYVRPSLPASEFKPANLEKAKYDQNPISALEKSKHDDGNNWKSTDDDFELSEWGDFKKKKEIKHDSNRHLAREQTEARSRLPLKSPIDPAASNKKWWEEDFEEPDLDDEPVAARRKWGNEDFDEDDYWLPDEDDDEGCFCDPTGKPAAHDEMWTGEGLEESSFYRELIASDKPRFPIKENQKKVDEMWTGEEENYFDHDSLEADEFDDGTYDANWDRQRFTAEKSGNGYNDEIKWTDFGERNKLDEEYYPKWTELDWNKEDRLNGQREKRRSNGFGRRPTNVRW